MFWQGMTLNKNEPLLLVIFLCREGNKKQISTLVSNQRYSNKVHEFLESCRFIWNLLQLSALLLVLFNSRNFFSYMQQFTRVHQNFAKWGFPSNWHAGTELWLTPTHSVNKIQFCKVWNCAQTQLWRWVQ